MLVGFRVISPCICEERKLTYCALLFFCFMVFLFAPLFYLALFSNISFTLFFFFHLNEFLKSLCFHRFSREQGKFQRQFFINDSNTSPEIALKDSLVPRLIPLLLMQSSYHSLFP